MTNQFMHPYHGAAYFSAARANGLGFWESVPYTFGGSLMWEHFMEDEPPSCNDIVNTPVTGTILGEISLRVSDVIIDESAVGFERVLRETGAMIINPVHGFNRLLGGDAWTSSTAKKPVDFSLRLSAGVNSVFLSKRFANNTTYALLGLDFGSRNQLDAFHRNDPFDYYVVHNEISFTKDDNIVGIVASGVLWDAKLNIFGSSKDVIGAYKEVDFLIYTVHKLSATSVTGQLIDMIDISPATTIQSSLSLSAILMGVTNSQYSIEYGVKITISARGQAHGLAQTCASGIMGVSISSTKDIGYIR